MRTHDVNLITEAVARYGAPIVGFEPGDWLFGANIALVNDKNDVALLEYTAPGKFTGHYFFLSRGKDAVTSAKDFLREAFEEHPVEAITGLTPHVKRGALWLNKQIGFTSYGTIETQIGPCEIVILTKKEWEKL